MRLQTLSDTKKQPPEMSITGDWNPPNEKEEKERLAGEETKLFAVAPTCSVR
jgi:hypothetical protein